MIKESARQRAIRKGDTRYYTGKPCKYGHFSFRKTSGGGCVKCEEISRKNPSNRAKRLLYEREYRSREHVKESLREKAQKRRKDPEASRRIKEVEKARQKTEKYKRNRREYRERPEVRDRERRLEAERRRNDPMRKRYVREYTRKYRKLGENRLHHSMRTRIRNALTGFRKMGNSVDLIGCSVDELWEHLERQFTAGMTRDNYGEWHVDHIVPISWFNMSDEHQQKSAFHYTNLQPLWAKDNIKKNNRYSGHPRDVRAEA